MSMPPFIVSSAESAPPSVFSHSLLSVSKLALLCSHPSLLLDYTILQGRSHALSPQQLALVNHQSLLNVVEFVDHSSPHHPCSYVNWYLPFTCPLQGLLCSFNIQLPDHCTSLPQLSEICCLCYHFDENIFL